MPALKPAGNGKTKWKDGTEEIRASVQNELLYSDARTAKRIWTLHLSDENAGVFPVGEGLGYTGLLIRTEVGDWLSDGRIWKGWRI